jgi:hypothetical protein
MTSIPETGTALATASSEKPKANKKATAGARRATPAKAKSGKKATSAKKAPKARTKAKAAKPGAHAGSKIARILDLLKRPGGATAKELMKATGWQPHSVRGFISLARSKRGVKITSAENEAGERRYTAKA